MIVDRWVTARHLLAATTHLRVTLPRSPAPTAVQVAQEFPRFVSVLTHTVAVSVYDSSSGGVMGSWPAGDCPLLSRLAFHDDGTQPATLSATLLVNASVSVVLSVGLRRQLMHVDAYPPDPNRGLDLPPAVVVVASHPHLALFAEPLLVWLLLRCATSSPLPALTTPPPVCRWTCRRPTSACPSTLPRCTAPLSRLCSERL